MVLKEITQLNDVIFKNYCFKADKISSNIFYVTSHDGKQSLHFCSCPPCTNRNIRDDDDKEAKATADK